MCWHVAMKRGVGAKSRCTVQTSEGMSIRLESKENWVNTVCHMPWTFIPALIRSMRSATVEAVAAIGTRGLFPTSLGL